MARQKQDEALDELVSLREKDGEPERKDGKPERKEGRVTAESSATGAPRANVNSAGKSGMR